MTRSNQFLRILRRFPLAFIGQFLAVGLLLNAGPSSADSDPATLIVTGARIWTGVTVRPWANALALRGDRGQIVV